jgi:hypothetical protein
MPPRQHPGSENIGSDRTAIRGLPEDMNPLAVKTQLGLIVFAYPFRGGENACKRSNIPVWLPT